jgi:NIMA (never in mitosis gene a)-related kinase
MSKDLFHFHSVELFCVCLFHFIIFKEQVSGDYITEKQGRIHPDLQSHSCGSEPSLSRQRRQKKREQTEHRGGKSQASRDLFAVSCASVWDTDSLSV